MACGPIVDPELPGAGGSTGDPGGSGSTDADAAETGLGTTSETSEGADAPADSTGEPLEGWCLESRALVQGLEGTPGLITHADVDGDGRPKLWLSEPGGEEFFLHAVGLDDDGQFGEVVVHDVGRRLHAVLDVDGDGHDDAVSVSSELGEPSADIRPWS